MIECLNTDTVQSQAVYLNYSRCCVKLDSAMAAQHLSVDRDFHSMEMRSRTQLSTVFDFVFQTIVWSFSDYYSALGI